MPRVLIIQQVMKHYRLPFFVGLHDDLAKRGIELNVAYSDPNSAHASRKDDAELPAGWGVKVKARWFFKRFLYQPLWKQIAQSDLIIVGPEVKYLINPVLLVMSAVGRKQVAFWGLGPNLHPDRSLVAEWVKDRLFTKVDWWFAYTESIAEYLRNKGMPADRITTVQNATDTTDLRRLMAGISEEEVVAAKIALTGNADTQIGFYCGMLHPIKSIPLLIEASRRVKQEREDFHLVLIGNGPERSWLEEVASGEPWIHYLGSKFGRDSALYYRMADLFLMSGTAGLAVVDSFAAGIPLLATRMSTHPPEISYVQDGENGRLSDHSAAAFAALIIETLSDRKVMDQLKAGARKSGNRYTIESMISNYSNGITSWFAAVGRKRS